MRILANELALPLLTEGECHASHFTVTPEGEVLCVYFLGSHEGRGDVRIYGSRRTSDGVWQERVPLSDDDGLPHWNPVLFERRDGTTMLFYKVGTPIAEWRTLCRLSEDGCRTFSAPCELVAGDTSGGRGPVRNKPIYLKNGDILAPASTERGEWKCFFDRSRDGGLTWERGEDIALPDSYFADYSSRELHGIIQPTLWEDTHGVHALLRSSEGRIFRTDAEDGWHFSTPYPTDMPNNNSGIDLVSLPDGRLLLVCNPIDKNWGARTPLSLYVSEDGGRSFSLLSHLVTGAGRYDYPAAKWANGLLHITYTWNRKSIGYLCLALS